MWPDNVGQFEELFVFLLLNSVTITIFIKYDYPPTNRHIGRVYHRTYCKKSQSSPANQNIMTQFEFNFDISFETFLN